ncbi:MAG: 50S ribosomal protein L32 [Candidatus Omnitrophica bacterium]|nr:50S ribosomal protein L32 [Candidatus Omnitrophota bacterium]
MPLPKRRHSKQRGRKRRTHWKLSALNLVPCPQCKTLNAPHQACKVCGHYKGRQAVEVRVKEKKKRKP